MPRVTRKPSHAGSWYTGDPSTLSKEIDEWMSAVTKDGPGARAIIGPHAGYRYCGHVMAHAYRHINPETVSRIFLLGPSHHFYTKKCLLSRASAYETPLGPLEVDQEVYQQLQATGQFDLMELDTDEAEHSVELHTPYVARVMQGRPFKLVPIVVGALSTDSEAECGKVVVPYLDDPSNLEAKYGKVLGPYLDDPANIFIISSDFCHWGRRFSYTEYDESQGPIWKSIQWLDELGIKAIETGRPEPFSEYLMKTRNTICGRHPIGVLLNMLQHCKAQHKVEFKHYDQSSKCQTQSDSSVSYAAAVVTLASE